jgi:hypothetical protein
MRVESQYGCRQVKPVGGFAQSGKQYHMPFVHTVEIADRQCTGIVWRIVRESAEDLHQRFLKNGINIKL